MRKRARTVTVYEVLYQVDDAHPSAHGGPAGDGTFTFRTASKLGAYQFAFGKLCYGQPASVIESEVSAALAARWGV